MYALKNAETYPPNNRLTETAEKFENMELKVNDFVRIRLEQRTFRQAGDQKFSSDTYKITEVIGLKYKLQNTETEQIEPYLFSRHLLLKVEPDKVEQVEPDNLEAEKEQVEIPEEEEEPEPEPVQGREEIRQEMNQNRLFGNRLRREGLDDFDRSRLPEVSSLVIQNGQQVRRGSRIRRPVNRLINA